MTATGGASGVLVTRRGGPEVLRFGEVALPAPGPHDVTIAVAASGVALGDLMLREGARREVALPAVPGYDVAGTVVAVGDRVSGLDVGRSVVGWTGGTGGYATAAVLPDWAVVPAPAGVAPEQAVAVVLNYVTAWQMLTRSTAVQAGDRVLVHGGAGGVGTALLQLARLLDVTVLATVSTGKRAAVAALGATPIDHRTEDVPARVRALAPDGLDAVYDALGADSWRRSLAWLRPGGRLVVYGATGALPGGRLDRGRLVGTLLRAPRPSVLTYATRGVGVVGYNIVEQTAARHDRFRADLTTLLGHLAAGRIRPVVADVLPLADAATAHRRLGGGTVTGKLVLTTG